MTDLSPTDADAVAQAVIKGLHPELFKACGNCQALTSLAHLQSAVMACPSCGFTLPLPVTP